MAISRAVFGLAAVVILVGTCAPPAEDTSPPAGDEPAGAGAVDTQAEGDRIRELDRQWSEAAGRHDAQAFASYYAEDGMVMPPNVPTARGPAAIQETMTPLLSDTTWEVSWQATDVHVADSGDMAWLHGSFTIRNRATGEDVDRGKLVEVWEKRNGEWKVVADIFNSDMPAASN